MSARAKPHSARSGSEPPPITRRALLAAGAAVASGPLAPQASRASVPGHYPDRAITLVVPASSGSGPDASARRIAQRLATSLGQAVIVDDRAGAAGIPAADFAARAPADGYTLFFGTNATLCINPCLYAHLPYDPRRSFAPISMAALGHPLFLVDPRLQVTTMAEWIAKARAHPGELALASSGRGSVSHLAGELLQSVARIELLHVPYKEESHAIADVIAGHVQCIVAFGAAALGYARTGKLRALTVAGPRRLPLLPDVPAAPELGLSGFDVPGWLGLLAPAGTPVAIIDRLHDAVVGVVNEAEYRDWLHALGSEVVGNTPAQFEQQMRADTERWGRIAKAANVHLD